MARRDIETSMSLLPTSVCVSVCLMMYGVPMCASVHRYLICGSSPHAHKSDSAPLALVPDAAGQPGQNTLRPPRAPLIHHGASPFVPSKSSSKTTFTALECVVI